MRKRGAIQWDDVDAVNLGNVIPFRPPRDSATALVQAGAAERPAPDHSSARGRSWWPLLLLVSVMAHAGVAAAFFLRMPESVPSIGLDAIEVEIVAFGADKPAGVAPTPGEQEAQPEAPHPPEEPVKQEEAEVEPPVEPSPVVPPPDPEAVTAEKPKEQPKKQQAAPATAAAGDVGRGQSRADANYDGQVAAHLARHKRFPQGAKDRQGSAVVSFSLDGRGRVIAVKLVTASGIAALDNEAVDMVRRASPFPAPPRGGTMEFTVPVTFQRR